MQDIRKDLGKLLDNKNFLSTTYSVLTVGLVGAGAAYIFAPEATLTGVFSYAKGSETLFMWRIIGSALLALPTWTYSLKVR
jgi:hypothetical protein